MTRNTHNIGTAIKKIEKLALTALKEHDFFQGNDRWDVAMEVSETDAPGFDRVLWVTAKKVVKSDVHDGLKALQQIYAFTLKPAIEGVAKFADVTETQVRIEMRNGSPRISYRFNQADSIWTLLTQGHDQFSVYSMLRMGLYDDYKGLTAMSGDPYCLRVDIAAAPEHVREIVGLDDESDIELVEFVAAPSGAKKGKLLLSVSGENEVNVYDFRDDDEARKASERLGYENNEASATDFNANLVHWESSAVSVGMNSRQIRKRFLEEVSAPKM